MTVSIVDERHGRALLLELDPELGQLLDEPRRRTARHEVRARLLWLEPGPWDAARLAGADPAHLGLLLVDGVLARNVALDGSTSMELLGPGDILRPWALNPPSELVPIEMRWTVLARTRLALIDREVALTLARYPEITAVVASRLNERARRLTITQAISQLTRVDERLLALFWHLAERWGKVAPDGVTVPLPLPHRLLGDLIGARRPTVSTALGKLAQDGQLVRRGDGTWLLTGEPPESSVPAQEVIRQRRRLMPSAGEPVEPPASARLDELRVSLETVRAITEAQQVVLEELHEESDAIRREAAAIREQRRQRRLTGP